ncbi:MAG: hypothetical protein ACTSRU_12260, partial [Candidatus Hodarchaeales archaeon]
MGDLSVRLMRRMVKFILPDVRTIVPEDTPLIEPVPESLVGLTVPEVIAVHGAKGRGLFKLVLMIPQVLITMRYARKGSRSVAKNPPSANEKADRVFFDELEARARDMGCTAIGYTEIP